MKPHVLRRLDFTLLKKRGMKVRGRCYIILFLPTEDPFKWGVIASKKVGNAVSRNYHKRCVREIFRTQNLLERLNNCKWVVICLPFKNILFEDKKKDLLNLTSKIESLVNKDLVK